MRAGSWQIAKRRSAFTVMRGALATGILALAALSLGSAYAEERDAGKWDTITACRLWKCPGCGTILEKGALGKVVQPGERAARIVGTATCGKCRRQCSQSDVYGGRYDYDPTLKEVEKGARVPANVSVVVFALRSDQPPTQKDALDYCTKALSSRHPKATLSKHFLVGFRDTMTAKEAAALYQSLVKERKLPDLGSHFDSFAGPGPDKKPIAALFFEAKAAEEGEEKK